MQGVSVPVPFVMRLLGIRRLIRCPFSSEWMLWAKYVTANKGVMGHKLDSDVDAENCMQEPVHMAVGQHQEHPQVPSS